MAFKEVFWRKTIHRKTFFCDTEADVESLPKCITGSEAVIVSTGELYVVNASGNWVKFGGGAV